MEKHLVRGKIIKTTKSAKSQIVIEFDGWPDDLNYGDEVVVGPYDDTAATAFLGGFQAGIKDERTRWIHDLRMMCQGREEQLWGKDDDWDTDDY